MKTEHRLFLRGPTTTGRTSKVLQKDLNNPEYKHHNHPINIIRQIAFGNAYTIINYRETFLGIIFPLFHITLYYRDVFTKIQFLSTREEIRVYHREIKLEMHKSTPPNYALNTTSTRSNHTNNFKTVINLT